MTIFVAAGCAFTFGSASALAQTAPVTIDSHTVDLDKGDKGTDTAALGFTNLTGKPITLTAKPVTAEPGCDVKLAPGLLPVAEHSDVTATVAAGCTVDKKKGITFTASSTSPASSFTVTAAPKPEPTPEWGALWAFPIALGALLLIALVVGASSITPPWTKPLKYLESTWSFSDSWVTNVTALGGLLAALFGSSDVVRALTGKDADSAVALATVGAAVALLFAGAGPIVLLATKTKVGDFTSAGGLLVGSAVTLAGAFGELWVVYRSGSKLDLGGWEDRIVYLLGALFALLILYAFRTIRATLEQGVTEPPPPPPPDAVVAAQMIVEALKAREDTATQQQLDAAVGGIADQYAAIGTSPSDEYLRTPRSALL